MNNKVLKILSKYYEQIYHTIYLCTDDEKLAEEITIKVFAKLYHSAPNFREDITNINWLLENSLRMLKYMEKCENKKDRKCHTLSMLNNEQIAILYTSRSSFLPSKASMHMGV